MPGKKKIKGRKLLQRIRTKDLPPPADESALDLYCGLPFAKWRVFCLTQHARAIDKKNPNRHKDSVAVIEARRVDCEIIKAAVMSKVIGQSSNAPQNVPQASRADLAAGVLGLLADLGDSVGEIEQAERAEAAAHRQGAERRPTGTDVVVAVEDA